MSEQEIVEYFEREAGIPKNSLKAKIEGEDVILTPLKWLDGQVWCDVMEWVDAIDGQWNKQPKPTSGFWTFDYERIKERIDYEKGIRP